MFNNNQKVSLLARYFSAGIFVALFQFATFLFLLYILSLGYLFASTVAFILTIIISFIAQRGVVFVTDRPRAVSAHVAFLVLFINSLFGLGVNWLIMYSGVEYVYVSEVLWQIVSMVFLAAYNFFFYQFLFRPQSQ